jgi:vancomycin resistance protein YoaR
MKNSRTRRKSKKGWLLLGIVLGGVGVSFTILAARYEPKIQPGVKVGDVEVGGLSHEEAKYKIRKWWEEAKRRELTFQSQELRKLPPATTPGKVGIAVDDDASVASLPVEEFGAYLVRTLTRSAPAERSFSPKLKFVGTSFSHLKDFVADNAGAPKPARIRYVGGSIVREPEQSGLMLDEDRLPELIMAAIHGDGTVELPLVSAPKRVPDAELGKITEVMTEFSTSFSPGKVSRSSNIKLAAEKLDGVILMPGETLSFNNTVGKRTVQAGFLEAGVYANGRHDTGIGGGICQVSTTLYNAALFANLKIKERQNHSMPVPYVPVGRDATVDYGNIDLRLENSYDFPIAITSEYKPGKLTFRVLGVKDPSLKVEVIQDGHRSWATAVKQVPDPSLPAGATKVIEKGSSGHAVQSYRLVYRNGELVLRESLGQSTYRGANRIIAVGTKQAAPAPPADSAPVPPPSG